MSYPENDGAVVLHVSCQQPPGCKSLQLRLYRRSQIFCDQPAIVRDGPLR